MKLHMLLLVLIVSAPPALSAGGDEPTRLDAARAALVEAEAEADSLPLLHARAMERVAAALGSAGRAESEALLRRALAVRERVQGEKHADVAETARALGVNLMRQRRYGEGEPLLQKAIAIQEVWFGPERPEVARTLYDLGSLYYFDRRPAHAVEALERAAAIHAGDERSRLFDLPRTLERLASALAQAGEDARAAATMERWLGVLPDEYADSIAITEGLEILGRAYRALERHDEADALFERRLSIYQVHLGEHDDIVLVALGGEAVQALMDGRADRAEDLFRRRLALLETQPEVAPLERARLLRAIGMTIPAGERDGEAEALVTRALTMAREALDGNDPSLAQFLTAMADIHERLARFDEAIALQEEALPLLRGDPDSMPRAVAESEDALLRLHHERRAARLGPQPLPQRFAREGIVYNSQMRMPERFDMEVERVDRAHVEHAGQRVSFWDLAAHAQAAGASSLLVRGMGNDDLCGGIVLIEHGLWVFFQQDDGEIAGLQLRFTEQDTLQMLWQTCRIALAPDPD
jgi:tetratricopeptide (TPR) repeat protein